MDFLYSKKFKQLLEVFLIATTFMALMMGVISAVRAQISPRPDIDYIYGIAWTQWAGVLVLGFVFSVVIRGHIKDNSNEP